MSESIVASTLGAARAHPGQRLVWKYVAWAVVMGAIAAISAAAGAFVGVLAFGAISALFAWSAWVLKRGVREVSLLNRTLAACRSGEDEEARALLEALEARSHSRGAARLIAAHRALLALDAGDPKSAEKHATAAIEKGPGVMARDLDRSHIAWAHALRALARAAMKDDANALADAEQASDERYATPTARGCGELARALVAANGDRKAEVRESLARATPFLDDVGGRDRAVARSLARFAAERPRTVYRHAAKPDEPELGALLSRPASIKSSVAAFETSKTGVPLPKSAKARAPNIGKRALVLWVILILTFLAIWQVLNPSAPGAPPAPSPAPDAWSVAPGLGVLFVGLFFGLVAFATWKTSRRRVAFRRALHGARRGDATAIAVLEAQAKQRSPDALLALAQMAERGGDFAVALARCEEGLAFVEATAAARAIHWDLVAPALAAERAFCLAALGRADEATAVIGAMPNASNYVHAATAHFRVRLAQALTRGDRAAALEVARSRGDRLSVPSRDAFVCDLLEATIGRGADDDEWSRLNAELAADPALAKWVDHFMPKSTIERRVVHADPLEEEDESDAEAVKSL